MKSTSEMRARLRELSKPDEDDYDRAVMAVLDDLEALRDALEPFGEVGKVLNRKTNAPVRDEETMISFHRGTSPGAGWVILTAGDFRLARSTLLIESKAAPLPATTNPAVDLSSVRQS